MPVVSSPIAGRYQLLEEIHHGHNATTHMAYDRERDRLVALKLLGDDASAADRRRFELERRHACMVRHPNVVPVLDYGEVDGRPYLVTEWVDGHDLAQDLERRGRLPIDEAVDITRQILAALQAIHRRGIVLRDVKPANILLTRQGVVKATDFSIAHGSAEETLTPTGQVIGTAAYMSPEQAHGQPVSAASDLYAVGVLLFRMVTGRLPFQGDDRQIMEQHISSPPPRPRQLNPAVPRALEQVILTALEKDPARRFADAAAMARALPGGRPARRAPGARAAPEPTRHRREVRRSEPPAHPLFERLVSTLTKATAFALIAVVCGLLLLAAGQRVIHDLSGEAGDARAAVAGWLRSVPSDLIRQAEQRLPEPGGSQPGRATETAACPGLDAVQQATQAPVVAIDEPCAFAFNGPLVEVTCPDGYVCTIWDDPRVEIHAGEGQQFTTTAATFRFAAAYPADGIARDPCQVLQVEQAYAGDIDVVPVGFSCPSS